MRASPFPLLLALAAFPAAGQAELNRCNEDGRIVYRNTPCDDQAQVAEAAPPAQAARSPEIALLDGALRISVPAGYTRLSAEEMAVKFGRSSRPPFAAFADARRNATIAFTLSRRDQPFTEEQLPEFLAAMQELFPRLMAGLVWHNREVLSLNGRKWARLQLSAHALDTDVRNDMYFTPLRGAILGVNLTATVAAWPAAEPALRRAFRTVRLP